DRGAARSDDADAAGRIGDGRRAVDVGADHVAADHQAGTPEVDLDADRAAGDQVVFNCGVGRVATLTYQEPFAPAETCRAGGGGPELVRSDNVAVAIHSDSKVGGDNNVVFDEVAAGGGSAHVQSLRGIAAGESRGARRVYAHVVALYDRTVGV